VNSEMRRSAGKVIGGIECCFGCRDGYDCGCVFASPRPDSNVRALGYWTFGAAERCLYSFNPGKKKHFRIYLDKAETNRGWAVAWHIE
jgi:hypothetical protein